MSDASSPVRFVKPRILAIDVDAKSTTALRAAGFNLMKGSFGAAYQVEVSDGARPITTEGAELPELNEQEVLIVNLANELGSDPNLNVPHNVDYLWQATQSGLINPRPLAIARYREQCEKIFAHAGVCIVLSSPRRKFPYFNARQIGRDLYGRKPAESLDDWSFLEPLARAQVLNERGTEIKFLEHELCPLLKRGADDVRYLCSFNIPVNRAEDWVPLALNKYGNVVAGLYRKPESRQFLLLLPQMPNFAHIVSELLGGFIAEWRPDLFPELAGAKWVHRREYEIPVILDRLDEIRRIECETETRVKQIRIEIDDVRKANQDWYTLLRGTGDELVGAVIRSLSAIGFQSVVDVDEQEKKKGSSNRREDIQVHGGGPTLIIDVKGINDCPADDESTQAAKHAMMRMKEWNRTDVQPLMIVNHQRNIPPHERNKTVYRPEIIGNAEEQGLGLMTTWDLFRLLRNSRKLGWPADTVKAIFYRTGRIEPIPAHYREIGTLSKVWEKAHAVEVHLSGAVRTGDRIAIENGDSFVELQVESLMVDDQRVAEALAGVSCGVACANAGVLRPKSRVFRIGLT